MKFEEIPDYGTLILVEDWLDSCKDGFFIDYDGWGYWATEFQMSNIRVNPSDTENPEFNPPEWATHVMWFNK